MALNGCQAVLSTAVKVASALARWVAKEEGVSLVARNGEGVGSDVAMTAAVAVADVVVAGSGAGVGEFNETAHALANSATPATKLAIINFLM